MVLVIASTLNGCLQSIEQKPSFQVPRQRAHAKAGLIAVSNFTICFNCGDGVIEGRSFQRPDRGTNDFGSSGETLFAVGRNFDIWRFGDCDRFSRLVEYSPVDAARFSEAPSIFNQRA